ncbi:hypothetical protein [Flavobacterium sp. LS2R12]|uniref:hypothetical protein n=1 Tax=unclassified Flavobacterium TaxID=196869 RepID=UPI003AAEB0CD
MNNYNIVDINYTNDFIQEIVDEKYNSYISLKPLSYILLFGVTTVFGANLPQEKAPVFKTSEIEIMSNFDFQIEEYQKDILLNENYCDIECVNNEKKEWIETILSFKSLHESWDGFGALPLEIKSASNAITFLQNIDSKFDFISPVDVSPNPSGTVNLVWENEDNERLAVEIGNKELSFYTKFNNVEPEFFNNIDITTYNIEDITRKIQALF